MANVTCVTLPFLLSKLVTGEDCFLAVNNNYMISAVYVWCVSRLMLSSEEYSSLSSNFLEQYAGTMDLADRSLVYFNPHAIELKGLPGITIEQVEKAFAKDGLKAYSDIALMLNDLKTIDGKNCVLLFLS